MKPGNLEDKDLLKEADDALVRFYNDGLSDRMMPVCVFAIACYLKIIVQGMFTQGQAKRGE